MTVELLETLSIVSYLVAAVLLVIAVSLFFGLKIPEAWGEITGRTAKKAIESIRERNAGSGTGIPGGKGLDAKRRAMAGMTSTSGLQLLLEEPGTAETGQTRDGSETTVLQAAATTLLEKAPSTNSVAKETPVGTTLLGQKPATAAKDSTNEPVGTVVLGQKPATAAADSTNEPLGTVVLGQEPPSAAKDSTNEPLGTVVLGQKPPSAAKDSTNEPLGTVVLGQEPPSAAEDSTNEPSGTAQLGTVSAGEGISLDKAEHAPTFTVVEEFCFTASNEIIE